MKKINKLIRKIKPNSGGRNNKGVITVYHRGGGNKKKSRIIDFVRKLFSVPATILWTESDPNRTSKIALARYKNGILSYILCPEGLKKGNLINAGPKVEMSIGNALPLGFVPIGTTVHNVELKPGGGGKLVRAAGTYAKMVGKDETKNIATIRLHSGKLYSLSAWSMATIGRPAGSSSTLKKAGQSRWKNRRPIVRGVAMNPVDHPHGGGEGRSKGGRHPVTPWGKLTKGKKTSRNGKKT